MERHFARAKIPVHTVLDLACGTGSLTWELARRGYEMIGVDRSEEMLAQANEKGAGLDVAERPIFLHQSMDRLDLYGTIDACVCCLDSVNYVTRPAVLEKAFQRVHLFLMPGGVFIFDVNTPEKLRGLDGQVFLDETEDTYCVWRAEYAKRRRICTYAMDIFRQTEGGLWERGEELHGVAPNNRWKCSPGGYPRRPAIWRADHARPPGGGTARIFARHERNYST